MLRSIIRRFSSSSPSDPPTMSDETPFLTPVSLVSPAKRGRSPSDNAGIVDKAPPPPPFPSATRQLQPYELPPSDGACPFLRLPEEVMVNIFSRLDRCSLTRSFRICRALNEFLSTNSAISLYHLLLTQSLRLNPHSIRPTADPNHVPPTSVALLSLLRERITRFKNFAPKSSTEVSILEPDGRLYEYLEGVLIRGIGLRQTTELAIYDLRKVGDWIDEPSSSGDSEEDGPEAWSAHASARNSPGPGRRALSPDHPNTPPSDRTGWIAEEDEMDDVRTTKKFGFAVAEFAIDPGQDLLVLVELRPDGVERKMLFHFLSLASHLPHPKAALPIVEWPTLLPEYDISLDFQISDDGFFVLNHHKPHTPPDQICGWQWTTGRLGMICRASSLITFQAFVLLTPSSFVIPSIIAGFDEATLDVDRPTDPFDLTFTHHLHIYAFPPFPGVVMLPNEPVPPPHTAIHVTTIDLPRFEFDIRRGIAPPRFSIRTDPPPRTYPPTHPEGRVQPFLPDPRSGVCILDMLCQSANPQAPEPHCAMAILKSTLIQYLPAPTSPLLTQAFPRPAPVVPWETIAPFVRFFGPDIPIPSWVCYVYQNRWLSFSPDDANMRLFDFDPLRCRQEYLRRKYEVEAECERCFARIHRPKEQRTDEDERHTHNLDGDDLGIWLQTRENTISSPPFTQVVKCGSEFPYMHADKRDDSEVGVIDGERIVALNPRARPLRGEFEPSLTVWEF